MNETTGFSPTFLVFGRESRLAREGSGNLHEEDLPQCTDFDRHHQKLMHLEEISKEVKERMKKAYEKNTVRYNQRQREQQFHEGQRVWKRNFAQTDAANFKSCLLYTSRCV